MVGAATQLESEEIFLKSFAPSNGKAQTADGLQSRCWICNQAKRRGLGVTIQSLTDMWEAQGGKCSICTKGISIVHNAHSTIHANIDHDEVTQEIRGLLCGDCNRGIGLLRHSVSNLHRAIQYLTRFEIKTSIIKIRSRA